MRIFDAISGIMLQKIPKVFRNKITQLQFVQNEKVAVQCGSETRYNISKKREK